MMSSSNKKIRFIVIINFVFVILLSETKFTGKSAKVDGLTDKQLKEIEALRQDLNVAFEKHEEESVAEQGVIVQPGWTQSKSDDTKAKTKVEVTNEGLAEIKALRAEIDTAVKKDSYVEGDAKSVKKVEKELSAKAHGKEALNSILGATAGTGNDKLEDHMSETVGSAFDGLEGSAAGDTPNVVDANAALEPDIDIRKLQRLEVSKRRTKETLVFKMIEEDFSFNLGEDVQEWEHILHAGKEYFIGRRVTDLFIVHKDSSKYEPANILNVGQPISYLDTYSFWNVNHQQQEGVILVATEDRVLWYRGDSENGGITLYWEWVIGTTVSGLTYFTAETNSYLAISSNQSSRAGFYMLNIYQFNLENKEFWIAQRLQLQHPFGKVTVLDTGRDIILSMPQNNTAAIYTFNPHTSGGDHLRFILLRNVESEGIESVTGFQMGGRSYLALGGLQPQILLYQQGDFVPKTILGSNFGLVELFFPIPARTYRDDLILLIQHRVDFGTHRVTVLETLIWDGVAFQTSIPVPCQLGGHTVYGVSCMLDIQRDEGLKGAALLRRGDEISIIVPRHNAESGLFRLHTELLAKNSELLDLQEIFAFLQDWVKEQDVLITQAQAFLGQPTNNAPQAKPDLSELETLKIPELIFSGDVGEIFVNDYKWSEEDSQIELDFIMNAIEQLDNELNNARQRRDVTEHEFVYDTLDLESLDVEELIVEMINNEKFYIQEANLNFEGILNLHSLEVLDDVQNQKKKRETMLQLLEINDNVEFAEINGILWSDIGGNIVYRTEPLQMAQLDIEGDIITEDALNISALNSLKFAGDYLWSSGPAVSIITAPKIFTGTLEANAIDTNGHINGMNPLDAITLSDPQDWTGSTTFTHLEVSEKLELNGTVHARNFEELPSNPTLEETNVIIAACSFQHLEVHGSIRVEGKFADDQLKPLIADIVQRHADATTEIIVSSKKSFSDVTFPLDFHITDAKVNDIAVEKFVTVHTKQELGIQALQGYIYFHNLTLSGLYDGVDVNELLKNAIRTDEPQNSPHTQLNFVEDIKAESFEVNTNLNGVSIAEQYKTLQEDLITLETHFNELQAKTANIPNDIEGNARLNGLYLHEFLEKHTWAEPNNMGNIYLNELLLLDALETDELHGIAATYIFNFLDEIVDLPEMILDGKIQVDHITVTGDVYLTKLNGKLFDEDVQMTVIWLNRPNYLSNNLEFKQPIEVLSDLIVLGDYNGHNLPDIIDDMIFHPANQSILISAPKSFLKRVNVLGNTALQAINSLPFSEIANKYLSGHLKGALKINGKLIVNELQTCGYLNEYFMSSINSIVRFDRNLQRFVLLGDNIINHQMFLEDLTVHGNFINFTNTADFMDNLLFKDQICMLKGRTTFSGRVSINRGAYVSTLNDYNLLALLNNIVYIHDSEVVYIRAPVVFNGIVEAPEVGISSALTTSNLNSCSLEEWLEDTLRVDLYQNITGRLHYLPWSLEGNSIYSNFLNDIDLTKVVTLHTPQNLTSDVIFSEVYLNGLIVCNKLINGVDLYTEYENTLLTYGDQHVSTPLTMQSIHVLGNLETKAPVNSDKDLRQVATLYGDLVLASPLFFQNVTAAHLNTTDLLSGIDMDKWMKQSLSLNNTADGQQLIKGNWTVRRLTVHKGPTLPSYVTSGLAALEYATFMRTPRDSESNYAELCQKVNNAMESHRRKHACVIKYLKQSFEFIVPPKDGIIRTVFALQNTNGSYLFINMGCQSLVFMWNATQQYYEKVTIIATGPVDQVFLVPSPKGNASLEFITNYESTEPMHCAFTGLSSWSLESEKKVHERIFNEPVAVIQTKPFKLYAIEQKIFHEIKLNESGSYVITNWTLPQSGSYRFVPQADDSNLLLVNDEHFLLLRNKRHSKRAAPDWSVQYQRLVKRLETPTESILKPNETLARKLSFSDFRQVIERILSDLVYRLHVEIKITQLSIPESDLYDKHLVQDFIDIMQELLKQHIFPEDTFDGIDLKNLQIPGNSAQVLAARTVQIIWPVIVEIEEVHNYLRDNKTDQHPVCACITSSLGMIVRDVLLLANSAVNKNDSVGALMPIIERIREFQEDLDIFTAELRADIKKDLNSSIVEDEYEAAPNMGTSTNKNTRVQTIYQKQETVITSGTRSYARSDPFIVIKNLHLPVHDTAEFLAIKVGPELEPRALLAVTNTKTHSMAGQHDVINIYTDNLRGDLFQVVNAQKPRALATLRIRDETLLAYVEDCCIVKVLIYRGVQGFVEFSHISTETRIIRLFDLSLPTSQETMNYYFAVVLEAKISFYEVVVAGLKELPKIACN